MSEIEYGCGHEGLTEYIIVQDTVNQIVWDSHGTPYYQPIIYNRHLQ